MWESRGNKKNMSRETVDLFGQVVVSISLPQSYSTFFILYCKCVYIYMYTVSKNKWVVLKYLERILKHVSINGHHQQGTWNGIWRIYHQMAMCQKGSCGHGW